MAILNWIGKEAVVNHDKEVPFKLLEKIPSASVGKESKNLIIHGDNLEALKALMPFYQGKVKCVYIDPPYNTGNEGWVYNDKVNSPKIREWLKKVVGGEGEDLTRHDKWLCMMYPRLKLLKELLSEDGAIFVSIDDNENPHLRQIMDEVFNESNFVATFIWEKRTTRENRRVFSFNHDYVVCYAKRKELFETTRGELPLTDEVRERYSNPDNDPRGSWQSVSLNAQAGHATPSQFYKITTPSGRELQPPRGRCWVVTKPRLDELIADDRVWFGADGRNVPRLKKFLSENSRGLTPHTLWTASEVGTTDSATKEVTSILGDSAKFETPKPVELIERIVQISSEKDSIILDSFAGSGTTAHAVMKLNLSDGGARRFILVEMEDHVAKKVTAERVKRVNKKYNYLSDFGYCELGEPLFDEKGKINNACTYDELATYIYFTETQTNIDKMILKNPLVGESGGISYYLIYAGKDKNDLTREKIPKFKLTGPSVIYADRCLVDEDELKEKGITFKQIPYEIKVY